MTDISDISTNTIGFTYGIFTYIYHEHKPNVGKYITHGSSGNGIDYLKPIFLITDLWKQAVYEHYQFGRHKSSNKMAQTVSTNNKSTEIKTLPSYTWLSTIHGNTSVFNHTGIHGIYCTWLFLFVLCSLVVANMSSVEHIISLGGCFQLIHTNISQPDHLLLNVGESTSTSTIS